MPKDRWSELCRSVAHDDNLPFREAGSWTEEKLYFWHRYIEITTTSMVGKSRWSSGLCYVDLFAGPGVCVLRGAGKRFPGSTLIAANSAKPFSKIIAVERDVTLADACEIRLSRTPQAQVCKVLRGDCNGVISDVIDQIIPGSLTLAFIDPEGLDARFQTIQRLTGNRSVDLLILFPDAMDISRNVERYYLPNPQSKLDDFLGPGSGWRDEWKALGNVEGERAREFFAKVYIKQLQKHLGYKQFGQKVMKWDRGPLYRLIYASRSEVGLKFWHEVLKKDVGGQRELF